MKIRAYAIALLVALVPAFLPETYANAQQGKEKEDPFTDMARQRFAEGVKLYDQKEYEKARAAFMQAYALKKHPAVLLNLAKASSSPTIPSRPQGTSPNTCEKPGPQAAGEEDSGAGPRRGTSEDRPREDRRQHAWRRCSCG